MSEFLDVPGASGAVYRFRRADVDALPATAGNLLVTRPRKTSPVVLHCAAVDSLAEARGVAIAALKTHSGACLYVRLNVSRAVREAEHADIAAGA